jgi:hypothetical protein
MVLAHWNKCAGIDMSPHADTLSWFRANQSLLFLLNSAFLAEKQQIPILYSLVWSDRGSYPRSTALEASTLTITPPMRFARYVQSPVILKKTTNTRVPFQLRAVYSICYCDVTIYKWKVYNGKIEIDFFIVTLYNF